MSQDISAADLFARYQQHAERISLRDPGAAGVILGLLTIARQLERQFVELAKAQPAAPPAETEQHSE